MSFICVFSQKKKVNDFIQLNQIKTRVTNSRLKPSQIKLQWLNIGTIDIIYPNNKDCANDSLMKWKFK